MTDRGQLSDMVRALKSPGLMVFDCRLEPVEVMSPTASPDSLDSLLPAAHPAAAEAGAGCEPVGARCAPRRLKTGPRS